MSYAPPAIVAKGIWGGHDDLSVMASTRCSGLQRVTRVVGISGLCGFLREMLRGINTIMGPWDEGRQL